MNFPATNTGARRCLCAVGQASRGTLQAKRSIHNIIARHLPGCRNRVRTYCSCDRGTWMCRTCSIEHVQDVARKADKILHELNYTGEKKPHMWWNEFEKQLTSAFH